MTLPTLHLNGTSQTSLLADMQTALKALHVARQAVAATGPHGRDYYVQAGDGLRAATAEFVARMTALEGVRRELEVLALAIANGGAGKACDLCGASLVDGHCPDCEGSYR